MWNQLLFSNSLVLDNGHSLFLLLLGLSACHASELQEFRLRDLLLLCVSVSGTGCAGKTAMHRDCHSGLDRDLCGVPRNFREALDGNRRKQTETDGNRRKQAETHGITRNSIWRFTRSGFMAVLSAKKGRFREKSPKHKNKINDCSVPRSA